MFARLIAGAAATALCSASAWQIVSPPSPRVIYNKSPSAPVGWYAIDSKAPITTGVQVAAFAPAEARNLAANRGYLPAHVPLIKTVWAIAGAEICATNGAISVPNRPLIHAAAEDGLGRAMPRLEGCFILNADEVFLVSTDVQTSFDSRYFGAVPAENIIGAVTYLGDTGENGDGARGERQ